MVTSNPSCYARFLHACADEARVDIFINGELIAENFNYGNFSEYFSAHPGIYHLAVYPTGDHSEALIEEHLEIEGNSVYTIAAAGRKGRPELSLICDKKRALNKSKAHIRFINLSSRDKLDVFLNGNLSIPELSYYDVSDYVALPSGSVSITAKDIVTGKILLQDYKVPTEAGGVYAGYFTGFSENETDASISFEREYR